jgi:hypothetical protein
MARCVDASLATGNRFLPIVISAWSKRQDLGISDEDEAYSHQDSERQSQR